MLNIFHNMRRFSTLKIAEIQLALLVFLVNFIVQFENEDSIVRCFHWIDAEGYGAVTEEELARAFVEYEDRPEKKAKQEAAEIMSKIDFNHSKDIDYSGTLFRTKNS
jgi:Ca2+-binding EF-hand superfamily protein